jgi:hypothetical protein
LCFRFQLVTKTHDTTIARAYLAVQEIEDSSSFAEGSGSGELLFSFRDDESESGEKIMMKKAGIPGGEAENGLENRAANKFFDDDDWENQQKRGGGGQGPSSPRFTSGGIKEKLTRGDVDGRTFKSGTLVHGAPWLER